jgi:hypothetical protein
MVYKQEMLKSPEPILSSSLPHHHPHQANKQYKQYKQTPNRQQCSQPNPPPRTRSNPTPSNPPTAPGSSKPTPRPLNSTRILPWSNNSWRTGSSSPRTSSARKRPRSTWTGRMRGWKGSGWGTRGTRRRRGGWGICLSMESESSRTSVAFYSLLLSLHLMASYLLPLI